MNKNRNTPLSKIITILMVAMLLAGMFASPAAAQGETPAQVGATLVFDAQNVAPAEMPADATAAKFAQMTLFTTVEGKVAESGEAVWYDLSVANAYPDMIKQYVSGTVSFWDSAPSGTQPVNVAPAPKTVTVDVSWFQPVIDLLDKLSQMLKDMMNSNGAPYVAPAPVAIEPAAAVNTGIVDLIGMPVGSKFYPIDGLTLTYSGTGNICGFESSVSWMLPAGASAEIQGHKYFSDMAVPPTSSGTYYDCNRQSEIKLATAVVITATPAPVYACTIADLAKLPGVKSVKILEAENGKVQLTFSGPSFTMPAIYIGDLDFMGPKYTTPGQVIPTVDGDTGNLWLIAACKPAK